MSLEASLVVWWGSRTGKTQKLILLALANAADVNGRVDRLDRETLAELAGLSSVRSVDRHVKQLVDEGKLEVIPRRGRANGFRIPFEKMPPREESLKKNRMLRRIFGEGGPLQPAAGAAPAAGVTRESPPPLQLAAGDPCSQLQGTPAAGASRKGKRVSKGVGEVRASAPEPPPAAKNAEGDQAGEKPGRDLVTEREETATEVGQWVMSLRPEWRMPAALTAAECHEVVANLAAFRSLDDECRELLRDYLAAPVPPGAGFWQPRRRGQLIENLADVMEHAMRWARKRGRKVTGKPNELGGGVK